MRTLVHTILAGVLLVCAAPPAGAAVELRGPTPHRYEYKLRWHPRDRVLRGGGQVVVVNAGPAATDRVWLRLRPNGGGTVLERIYGVRRARVARYAAGRSMVELKLDSELPAGGVREIAFRLRLDVPRADTSLGRSAGLDLFGDALPVVAVAGPRGLRIGPEPAYGEGSFNPAVEWRVQVRVPRGLRVILPGYVDKVRFNSSYSTYDTWVPEDRDVAFAIGRYRSLSRSVGHTLVTVYAPAALRAQQRPALDRAVRAFRTMQRWYGNYENEHFRVVLGDLEFGGSEYPGLVFSTPDNATIAHEVAHQWFYGLVGNDQYNDPFLDESLTAYAEQQFHRSYRCNLASPLDGRAHGLGTGMDYWQKHPKEYEHTIYRGGACALTVLRRDIGEAAFRGALRAYVAASAGKIAGLQDFLDAVRAAAPAYDLARWERLVGLAP